MKNLTIVSSRQNLFLPMSNVWTKVSFYFCMIRRNLYVFFYHRLNCSVNIVTNLWNISSKIRYFIYYLSCFIAIYMWEKKTRKYEWQWTNMPIEMLKSISLWQRKIFYFINSMIKKKNVSNRTNSGSVWKAASPSHKSLNLIIQFMSTKRGSFSSYPVFINNKFVENARVKYWFYCILFVL